MNRPLNTCIILNGPPGVGKDTLAVELEYRGFSHHRMKDALYEDTARYFNFSLDEFISQATSRKLKETKNKLLDERSPREALIFVSEKIIKPALGKDYYGIQAAKDCLIARSEFAVFSDGGFKEEVLPLQKIYQRVFIIQLHREGFTFVGDSRCYLEGFTNTSTVDLEEGQILRAVHQILEATTY